MKSIKSLALFTIAAAALVAVASPASAAFLTLQTGPTFTPAGDFSDNTIRIDKTIGGSFLHMTGGATVAQRAASDMAMVAISGTYAGDAGDMFSLAYSFTVDLAITQPVNYTLTGSVTVGGVAIPVSATGTLKPGLHQYQGTAASPKFIGPTSGNFSATLTFDFGSSKPAGPAAATQGTFDLNIQQVDFEVGPQAATLETPAQPQNLSTRVNVGTDQNVLIGGFIITGSQDKQVVLRAIGPSLAQDKIANPLADPFLELHDATGAVVASNDNWKQNSAADRMVLAANNLTPKDDAESALVQTLAPGAYTAIVRGVGGGTGVALVEVYDVDAASTSKVANISTRGNVGTGEDVMIGGFIVGGGGGGFTTTIVRGLGPSLAGSGVTNPLADPTLTLNDANGNMIDSNDNWMDNPNAQTISSDHLAPKDTAESALYEILPAGSYTAILSGANSSSGVGLVEIYDVNNPSASP